MKRIKLYAGLLIALTIVVWSCQKDRYRVGGDLHDPNIDMTTYDYLASHPQGLFDTLLMLVDEAGLKDRINQQGVTFFAPTDYAINNYVAVRTAEVQRVDPFQMWTVDSIMKYEMDRFADSLDIYFVHENLPNSVLTPKGKIYENAKGGEVVVSYEETPEENLGNNDNSTLLPRVVYFSYLYESLPPDFDAGGIGLPVGIRTLVQTSNAQTLTGTLQVLENNHILFYRR